MGNVQYGHCLSHLLLHVGVEVLNEGNLRPATALNESLQVHDSRGSVSCYGSATSSTHKTRLANFFPATLSTPITCTCYYTLNLYVLFCFVLFCFVLFCFVLFFVLFCCVALRCVALRCVALRCLALCLAWHDIEWHDIERHGMALFV